MSFPITYLKVIEIGEACPFLYNYPIFFDVILIVNLKEIFQT